MPLVIALTDSALKDVKTNRAFIRPCWRWLGFCTTIRRARATNVFLPHGRDYVSQKVAPRLPDRIRGSGRGAWHHASTVVWPAGALAQGWSWKAGWSFSYSKAGCAVDLPSVIVPLLFASCSCSFLLGYLVTTPLPPPPAPARSARQSVCGPCWGTMTNCRAVALIPASAPCSSPLRLHWQRN